VIGFIGSFYAYEGLDLLIDALPVIAEELNEVTLLLVGGGPEEEALRRRVAAAGLEERVVFGGRVAHDEVARYYSVIDLLVYPRRSMRLTDLVTPLKPLEAMAQGKSLLASDVGGHREIVQVGVTGQLFRAGDVEALANSAVDVLRDAIGCDRRRAAGRAYVEHERTWKRSVERYRDVYVYAARHVGTVAASPSWFAGRWGRARRGRR
jgi:glycosyltransferase involved in cell wall biosynthesis